MRPRRAFRPIGDALEARWVTSSLAVHHAAMIDHAEVRHVRHPAVHRAEASADPAITLINLFPFATGTAFFSTTKTPTTTSGVLVNTAGTAGTLTGGLGAGTSGTLTGGLLGVGTSGGASTIFSQVGSNYAVAVATNGVTYPGTFTGAGGDLNGLVLYGGPGGTPGGTLNGLVIF